MDDWTLTEAEHLAKGLKMSWPTKEEFQKTKPKRDQWEAMIKAIGLRSAIRYVINKICNHQFFHQNICPEDYNDELWITAGDEDADELLYRDLQSIKKFLNEQEWI